MKHRDILQRPHWTEKSTILQEDHNQVTFVVHPEANKVQIKNAVEELFDVKVEKVRVMRQLGKVKRFGMNIGRQPLWKKAYVSLAPGETIDMFEGV